jgi:hypothetical protein
MFTSDYSRTPESPTTAFPRVHIIFITFSPHWIGCVVETGGGLKSTNWKTEFGLFLLKYSHLTGAVVLAGHCLLLKFLSSSLVSFKICQWELRETWKRSLNKAWLSRWLSGSHSKILYCIQKVNLDFLLPFSAIIHIFSKANYVSLVCWSIFTWLLFPCAYFY